MNKVTLTYKLARTASKRVVDFRDSAEERKQQREESRRNKLANLCDNRYDSDDWWEEDETGYEVSMVNPVIRPQLGGVIYCYKENPRTITASDAENREMLLLSIFPEPETRVCV